MVTMEADQIVLISFVVAEKEILAMHTPIVVPPFFSFFDGLSFGVRIAGEGNVVLSEPLKNGVCSRTDSR